MLDLVSSSWLFPVLSCSKVSDVCCCGVMRLEHSSGCCGDYKSSSGGISAGSICGSGRAISKGCRYGLVGAGVGLRDGVLWLTSSSGGVKVGAGTGSLVDSFGIYHNLNATACSTLGDPRMCSLGILHGLLHLMSRR